MQVADQYGYNISVFVVDNSVPEIALTELELLTSRYHYELVVLGAEIDWAIKGALRQVDLVCAIIKLLPMTYTPSLLPGKVYVVTRVCSMCLKRLLPGAPALSRAFSVA